MEQKILSITIPTWNRAKMLEELLLELIQQICSDKLESKIELLISNNGSEDETEKIVLALKSKYDFITYNNNGVNKGARYNVLKCMELANAKYIILFGDDDRIKKGSLKRITDFLNLNQRTGLLFDNHNFKRNPFGVEANISLEQLVANFYYYLGNAGVFIIKHDYIKSILVKNNYEFFNGSWPQTQLMIMGASENPNDLVFVKDLDVFSKSLHDTVMIYTSYYLWRTAYYDLVEAIEAIKGSVTKEVYLAAKSYYTKNIKQNFFNILQCGIFLDDNKTRLKTSKDIFSKLKFFAAKEKLFLLIASFALFLPTFMTRPVSNLFIYLSRGKSGIKKKDDFVNKERVKRASKEKNGKVIREFDFVFK